MDINYIPVESVQERDVDLLIIEELNVSFDFCKWFIGNLGLDLPTSTVKSFRSVSDYGLGETDILISYNTNNKKYFILLENKIDATFQSGQLERYENRGENYVQMKECDESCIALIAPKSYCENQSSFIKFITYESIEKYFLNQMNMQK